jgi:hypothetical protein
MARTRDRFDDRWDAPRHDEEVDRGRGGIRITPMRIVLVLALIGSLAYIAFALTVRDTSQMPMLASGATVLGIVFLALAISGARGTYRAGGEGRSGQALTLAIGGGIAAMIGFGCFAAAIILALLLTAAPTR